MVTQQCAIDQLAETWRLRLRPEARCPLAPGFYHKIKGRMTTTQFSSSFCMVRQTAEIPDFPAFLEMVLE
jgi:hypothetical protein